MFKFTDKSNDYQDSEINKLVEGNVLVAMLEKFKIIDTIYKAPIIEESVEDDKTSSTSVKITKKKPKKKKSMECISEIPTDDDQTLLTESVEELPEQLSIHESHTEDGTPTTTVIKKRIIKKKKGSSHVVTEIQTVEEDGKEPITTVTVDEVAEPFQPYQPEEIEELPEHITVQETLTEEGTPKTTIIKKRIIKKKKGPIHEVTEIQTVEEEGKEPITTVIVDDVTEPFELTQPEEVEELPEQITIQETISEDGIPKKTIIKKRVIKKKKGPSHEVTEIQTVEEEGQEPITTITVDEVLAPFHPSMPEEVEELPEQIIVHETVTMDGTPKTTTIKKRIIKKKKGPQYEVTEIQTLEEEGKENITTVTVNDIAEPFEPSHPEDIEELPEETTIQETVSEEGIPCTKIIKKRIIKKKKGSKQEITEIHTIEQDDNEPITSVTVSEVDEPFQPSQPEEVEELPEQITIQETFTENGTPKTTIIKKRIIKKKKGQAHEVTEIRTVQEEGEKPITTVTVEEVVEQFQTSLPEEVEELPEQITVHETVSEDGIPKTTTVKKRTIKKKKGPTHEVTEIQTVEEEGKEPVTTVSVNETVEPILSSEFEEVEELPEQITVLENITEDGLTSRKIIKKRIIKKKKGPNQEITEIQTVEEDGKDIKIFVTTNEIAESDITNTSDEVVELPEQITIHEKLSADGVPQTMLIKKRIVKKKKGDTHEITEIRTVEEEGKEPVTSVNVTEVPEPFESAITESVEELPEHITIQETFTSEGTPLTTVIKKRVIKKRKGSIQEHIEIKTVEEDGKEPILTVSVEEVDQPFESTTPEEIEELPEQTIIHEQIDSDGIPKTTVTKKRLIKKKKGSVHEITEIKTIREDGKEPETSVIVEEIDEPFSSIEPDEIKELPEQITVHEKINENGVSETTVTKKRVLKKKKGENQEITEIQTTTVDDQEPVTSVVVRDVPIIDDDIPEELSETPEQITVHTKTNEDGLPVTTVTKNRVIKKKKGPIEEITKIQTVEEEGKEPVTSVEVSENSQPDRTDEVVELPEQTIVQSIQNEDGTTVKSIIKKRVIKKRNSIADEITEIQTVEEEGKEPVTTVHVTTVDNTKSPKKKKTTKKPKKEDEFLQQLQELMEADIPKTQLEEYEKIDFDSLKKPIEQSKEPVLKVPVERKEKKPIQVKELVVEQLEPVKLKPLRVTKVPKEIVADQAITRKLKSRITAVAYPPKPQQPIISDINATRQTGELSRSIEEIEKLKKIKPKKMKKIRKTSTDLEKVELEVYEKYESDSDEPTESTKYQRPVKEPNTDEPETKSLRLGKGKVKAPLEDEEEIVKLKKIPLKPVESEEVSLAAPKKVEPHVDKPNLEKIDTSVNISPFEPTEITDFQTSKETFETPEELPKEDKSPESTPKKIVKKKQTKLEPETIPAQLVLGVPKPTEESPEDNVSLKYTQKPKPDEEAPTIKLKPFKKPATDDVIEKDQAISLLPAKHDEPAVPVEEDVEKPEEKKEKKKKKSVKKTPTNEHDEIIKKLLEYEIEKPELEKYEKVILDSDIKPNETDKINDLPAPVTEKKVRKPIKVAEPVVEELEPLKLKPRKPSLIEKEVVQEHSLTRKLKSRITRVEYPPEPQTPVISDINATRQNGELARTIEEAIELKKIKPKKFKPIRKPSTDIENPDLEVYEKYESDSDEPTESVKYQRPAKEPKTDEPDNKTLKLGKGKVKTPETDAQEVVKLKKIPVKPTGAEEVSLEQPKKQKPQTDQSVAEKVDVILDIGKFEPFDIVHIEETPETVETPEEVPVDEPVPEQKPTKIVKKKKPKSEPETIPAQLVLGVPKSKETSPEKDVSFQYAQKPIPDTPAETHKLKPFEKPVSEPLAIETGSTPKTIQTPAKPDTLSEPETETDNADIQTPETDKEHAHPTQPETPTMEEIPHMNVKHISDAPCKWILHLLIFQPYYILQNADTTS